MARRFGPQTALYRTEVLKVEFKRLGNVARELHSSVTFFYAMG